MLFGFRKWLNAMAFNHCSMPKKRDLVQLLIR